ncbi:MAG TPA: hypothetical protein VIU86_01255 [Gaiellaceae bacterium]
MASGKRGRRETIRSMAVDPDLFDAAVWQQPDIATPAVEAGENETAASQPEPETN